MIPLHVSLQEGEEVFDDSVMTKLSLKDGLGIKKHPYENQACIMYIK